MAERSFAGCFAAPRANGTRIATARIYFFLELCSVHPVNSHLHEDGRKFAIFSLVFGECYIGLHMC